MPLTVVTHTQTEGSYVLVVNVPDVPASAFDGSVLDAIDVGDEAAPASHVTASWPDTVEPEAQLLETKLLIESAIAQTATPAEVTEVTAPGTEL